MTTCSAACACHHSLYMSASSQTKHKSANRAGRRSLVTAPFLAVCAALILSIVELPPHGSGQLSARSSFAVLEAAASADDRMPPEVSTSLNLSSGPEFTAQELHRARRILADQPAWLVPAQEGDLCVVRLVYPLDGKARDGIFAPAVMHNCVPERSAQAGQLVQIQTLGTSVATSRRCRVVGIVPNGVGLVHVEASDGDSATAPVNRNAYEVIVDEPTKAWFIVDTGSREKRDTVALPSFRPKNASPYAGPSDPSF
jgi:hypothetical protein